VQELGGIDLHKARNNFKACVPARVVVALDRILRDHASALPAGLAQQRGLKTFTHGFRVAYAVIGPSTGFHQGGYLPVRCTASS
jgi:hypothetical protein